MFKKLHWVAADVAVIACCAHGSVAFAQSGTTQSGTTQSGTNSQGSTQLEEIVVTAQRTSQKLQNVPIAVTAVTASSLATRGISSAVSLGNAVPGLQVTRQGTGTSPYIRGVGSNAPFANNEPSVATYIDGVYIAAPFTSFFSFNNIDRIEVLKGPQGTLFGRNATGGVIQVITRTPQFTPSMDMSLGYGNYNTVDVGAYVTGGLSDKIAFDVAAQYKDQNDGYGYNVTRQTDVYKEWQGSIRSKLLFKPTDLTTITLSGDFAQLKNDFYDQLPAPGVVSPIDPSVRFRGRYTTYSGVPTDMRAKTWGGSLTIKQDVGFASLVSITSRRIATGLNRFDRDFTAAPILEFNSPQVSKTWTQEVQLISKASGPLTWTVGGYYFYTQAGFVPAHIIGFAAAPPGLGTPTSVLQIYGLQTTRSYAAYGQATYAITDALKLTAGIRYTSDRYSIARGAAPGDLPITTTESRDSFKAPTWRLAADYAFTPDVHGYISYNRGVKSGGFDLINPGGAPYKGEKLDAYETGLKTELFDRRLRFNIAAFLYKYKDIQVSFNPGGVVITANAASATIKGIDADFEAAVTRNFRISGGVGYLHGRYGDFPNPAVYTADGQPENLANARGNTTRQTPTFTANALATYTIDTSVGKFAASANFYHNSGFFWDVDERLRAPEYNLVGASLSWTQANGGLGVRLWAENLTNEAYQVVGQPGLGFGDSVVYGAPRTYGVTLTSHF